MRFVPDWRVVPDRPHLVRIYCEGCESFSRPVKAPTEADKRRLGAVILYPDPPRGWWSGCPRCER